MTKIYANLLGKWTDITNEGTVADYQPPLKYFTENLTYSSGSNTANCFKFDYIHVQYRNKDYRLHPSMIQIVTEQFYYLIPTETFCLMIRHLLILSS